jgi:hypothetical protein
MVNMLHKKLNRFVETYFDGIKLNHENKEVYLFLRDHNAVRWVLMAEGVSDCMVLQMRTLNIIDRITFWDVSSNEESYIDKLFCLHKGYYPGEKDKRDFLFITGSIEKIKHDEMFLMELEPVFGANVLVLAKRAKLWCPIQKANLHDMTGIA